MTNFTTQRSVKTFFNDMKQFGVKLERDCLILRHAVDAPAQQSPPKVRCDQLQMYKGLVASVESADIRLTSLSQEQAQMPFSLNELTDACEALCQQTASILESLEECMIPYGYENPLAPVQKVAGFYKSTESGVIENGTEVGVVLSDALSEEEPVRDSEDQHPFTEGATVPASLAATTIEVTPPRLHKSTPSHLRDLGTPRTPTFDDRKISRPLRQGKLNFNVSDPVSDLPRSTRRGLKGPLTDTNRADDMPSPDSPMIKRPLSTKRDFHDHILDDSPKFDATKLRDHA